MKNKMRVLLATVGVMSTMTMTAFAGEWVNNSQGWRYENEDGTYFTSCWRWVDGNKDGLAECYYFDSDGYIITNSYVDDYQVDKDGAWVVDGKIQRKQVEVQKNTAEDVDAISGRYVFVYEKMDDVIVSTNIRTQLNYVDLKKVDSDSINMKWGDMEVMLTKSSENTYICGEEGMTFIDGDTICLWEDDGDFYFVKS